MLNLPTIRRKARKAPYQKPEAVRELERLAMDEARLKYPLMPFLAPRTFKDNDANSLTKCVVEYIRLSGGFASRISNQGTFSRKLNRYIPATSRKGLADVIGCYKGKNLNIEIKIKKDVQSEHQKKIESEIIRSGGLYYIAKDFTDFKIWFDRI